MSQNIIELTTKLYFLSDSDFYSKDYVEMLSSILQTVIFKENNLNVNSREDCLKITDYQYFLNLFTLSKNENVLDFIQKTDTHLFEQISKDFIEQLRKVIEIQDFSKETQNIIEENINTRLFLKTTEEYHPNHKDITKVFKDNEIDGVVKIDLNKEIYLPEELGFLSNVYKVRDIKKFIIENILDKEEYSEIIDLLKSNEVELS